MYAQRRTRLCDLYRTVYTVRPGSDADGMSYCTRDQDPYSKSTVCLSKLSYRGRNAEGDPTSLESEDLFGGQRFR